MNCWGGICALLLLTMLLGAHFDQGGCCMPAAVNLCVLLGPLIESYHQGEGKG